MKEGEMYNVNSEAKFQYLEQWKLGVSRNRDLKMYDVAKITTGW